MPEGTNVNYHIDLSTWDTNIGKYGDWEVVYIVDQVTRNDVVKKVDKADEVGEVNEVDRVDEIDKGN